MVTELLSSGRISHPKDEISILLAQLVSAIQEQEALGCTE